MRRSIVFRDYSEDTDRIAKLSIWFPEGIEFEVELDHHIYRCILLKEDKWYVQFRDIDYIIELASLNDTYWNARKIWENLDDYDVSCAVSGAINEIYRSIKDII